MHNDQRRLRDSFLPTLALKIASEGDKTAEQDCTLLNRVFCQGVDPLALLLSCPDEFAAVCSGLRLTVDEGTDAIQMAHVQGPGCLLSFADGGTGLPVDYNPRYPRDHEPWTWRREALWLVLASMSDCTEEGYTEDMTFVQRFQRAVKQTSKFSKYAESSACWCRPFDLALATMQSFKDTTVFYKDARGFVHAEGDHSFYVAYKLGHKVCAVHTTGPTFWGTTPDTSLAAQGILVGKEISPQFGLVFEDSMAVFEQMQ